MSPNCQTPIKKALKRVKLGQSDIEVSPIGAGTWQWGGSFYWGYGRSYTDVDLAKAFSACASGGINWFDTAEIYGRGRSEQILGKLIHGSRGNKTLSSDQKIVATKFFPYPWRWQHHSFQSALKGSLKRLGTQSVDLYQIHFPLRPRNFKYWVDALADATEDGLIKAVGVSNFTSEQTKRTHEILLDRGIQLASTPIGYSLLNRSPESNGVLEACRELGVSVISYGPLAEGLLTGKYGPRIPPPLPRRWRWAGRRLKVLPPLISLMKDIGSGHKSTPSQVALNWLIKRDTLPIPGVKSALQAADNAAAMHWDLTESEFDALNRATVDFLPD